MRVICGILCLFLCVYMLTFARVVRVRDGNRRIYINGEQSSEPIMKNKVRLVIPRPPQTGEIKNYSVFWVWMPFLYGLYCIVDGEIERRKKPKKE